MPCEKPPYGELLEYVKVYAKQQLDDCTEGSASKLLQSEFLKEPKSGKDWFTKEQAQALLEVVRDVLASPEFRPDHSRASQHLVILVVASTILRGSVSDTELKQNLPISRQRADVLRDSPNLGIGNDPKYNLQDIDEFPPSGSREQQEVHMGPSWLPMRRKRAQEQLSRYFKRRYGAATTFTIEQEAGRYKIAIDEAPPTRTLTKNYARDLPAGSFREELFRILNVGCLTDPLPGAQESVLCAGTLVSFRPAVRSAEVRTLLILPVDDGVYTDSLAFHLLGIQILPLRGPLPKAIQPNVKVSSWKLLAAQRVRLAKRGDQLLAWPVIGEPGILPLWALAHHARRATDMDSASGAEILERLLTFRLFRHSGRNGIGYTPVTAVVLAFPGAKGPQPYAHEAFAGDFQEAIRMAAGIAGGGPSNSNNRDGDKDDPAKKLSLSLASWVSSHWWTARRICLPDHGSVTDASYASVAEQLRIIFEPILEKKEQP